MNVIILPYSLSKKLDKEKMNSGVDVCMMNQYKSLRKHHNVKVFFQTII